MANMMICIPSESIINESCGIINKLVGDLPRERIVTIYKDTLSSTIGDGLWITCSDDVIYSSVEEILIHMHISAVLIDTLYEELGCFNFNWTGYIDEHSRDIIIKIREEKWVDFYMIHWVRKENSVAAMKSLR